MAPTSKRLRRSITRVALAIVVGAVVLLFVLGRGGPDLEVWHTDELDAEFTADKAEQLKSFDDYLRLEDALFAQLEEEVYARMATGPEYALVRYSAGSAADPLPRKPNWNRSFEFGADAPIGGVLLLHGLTDSPYTFRTLAETLNEAGFWVIGLRLPGHGTAPSGLAHVSWEDMAAAVEVGMKHLTVKVGDKPMHIMGYSTGAPLALDYVLNALQDTDTRVPTSLILLSPAVSLHPTAALAKWKRRLSLFPGLSNLAWLQVLPEFDPYKYNSFATNAAEQVHRGTRTVGRGMAARSRSKPKGKFPPTLVLKSTVDATVATQAVIDNLLAHLEPNDHELILFDINRVAVKSILLISDPAPLTDTVIDNPDLPFAVTLVGNESPETAKVFTRHKSPFSSEVSRTEPLGVSWPQGVISLSHVALPFPPDDPLYGQRGPENEDVLFLGDMAIRGERGLLKVPENWLMRLRHNPFYDYMEQRVVEWLTDTTGT